MTGMQSNKKAERFSMLPIKQAKLPAHMAKTQQHNTQLRIINFYDSWSFYKTWFTLAFSAEYNYHLLLSLKTVK